METCDRCETPKTCALFGCKLGTVPKKGRQPPPEPETAAPPTAPPPPTEPQVRGTAHEGNSVDANPPPADPAAAGGDEPSDESETSETSETSDERKPRNRVRIDDSVRAKIERIEQLAREQFPEATRVRGGVYGPEVYVEVWHEKEAKVYGPREEIEIGGAK